MAKTIKAIYVIDTISELYRDEIRKLNSISKKLENAFTALYQHNEDGGKNITVAEYENLKKLNHTLEQNKKLQEKYCDGIHAAREMIMNMVFDTVIEIDE